MAVRPRFGALSPSQAQRALLGLVAVDLDELSAGAPPPGPELASGRVRYIRADPNEEWLPWSQVLARGGGDCEDLAAAVAAERILAGHEAEPVVYQTGPGTYHVIVRDLTTGELLDPSLAGGMGSPRERAERGTGVAPGIGMPSTVHPHPIPLQRGPGGRWTPPFAPAARLGFHEPVKFKNPWLEAQRRAYVNLFAALRQSRRQRRRR